MVQISTYSVKLHSQNAAQALRDTAAIYRNAVDFYIAVIDENWDAVFANVGKQENAVRSAEQLSVTTKNRPVVAYDFGAKFYKFSSYLRRTTISEAYGKVSSSRSNLANWEKTDPRLRGQKPGFPKAGFVYPAMYRDNMFVRTGTYEARIKVFIRNTWDWITVSFRKSDVDYILHHCGNRKECVPTLQRRGKCWYLDFLSRERSNWLTLIFSTRPLWLSISESIIAVHAQSCAQTARPSSSMALSSEDGSFVFRKNTTL